MTTDHDQIEQTDDEFDLALARLEWVRTSRCLDIPAQATALRWHMAACDLAADAPTTRQTG